MELHAILEDDLVELCVQEGYLGEVSLRRTVIYVNLARKLLVHADRVEFRRELEDLRAHLVLHNGEDFALMR